MELEYRFPKLPELEKMNDLVRNDKERGLSRFIGCQAAHGLE